MRLPSSEFTGQLPGTHQLEVAGRQRTPADLGRVGIAQEGRDRAPTECTRRCLPSISPTAFLSATACRGPFRRPVDAPPVRQMPPIHHTALDEPEQRDAYFVHRSVEPTRREPPPCDALGTVSRLRVTCQVSLDRLHYCIEALIPHDGSQSPLHRSEGPRPTVATPHRSEEI